MERDVLWLAFGEYRGRTVRGFFYYLNAKLRQRSEEIRFRAYMADGVMAISHNSSRMGGCEMTEHFMDLIRGKTVKKDNRTGDEIAADVIQKCGLVVRR